MRNFFIFLILLLTTSCLDKDALDANKYDNLVLTPNILLPFVQVDLSYEYYTGIYEDQSITEAEINMTVDLFEKIDITESVTKIDFTFTAINGYPINLDLMNIFFLDEFGNEIEKIVLEDINAGLLNDDGSLKSATINEFTHSFESTSISALMYTRNVRVVISWNGNSIPYTEPHHSLYFKTYSDIILRTNIEIGK